MYLKALEVSNFKSFKGELTIPMDRGFTAITGPNGSGKSNCGDAIQFVLGPRSNKVIRAQNAKDLILTAVKTTNQPVLVKLRWSSLILCLQAAGVVFQSIKKKFG